MTKSIHIVIFALIAWLGFGSDVLSDRVLLRDGRVVEGRLIEDENADGASIVMQIGGAHITISRDQIEEIIPGGPAENTLIEARYALKEGRIAEAVIAMDTAAAQGGQIQGIATHLLHYGPELAEATPQLDDDTRAALRRVLQAVAPVRMPRQNDLQVARLMIHTRLGDHHCCGELLEAIGADYFEAHPETRGRLTRWLLNDLDAAVQAERFEAGSTILDEMDRVDPAVAQARAAQFYLQWAWFERQAESYESALRIYVQYLLDASPHITRDRIAKVLEEAERYWTAQREPEKAIALYERFGLVHTPQLARKKLARMWNTQGWNRVEEADFDAARRAFELAEQFEQGAGRDDLARLEYTERRAALKPENALGHFELGLWALEKNLLAEAFESFDRASQLDRDVIRVRAREYLDQIAQRKAEAELLAILGMYREGDYGEALKRVEAFVMEDHPLGYIAQAREIEQVVKEAIYMRTAERPQQAEALYQQAQRAFNQERYDEAGRLLQTIFDHYQNTVVHAKARNFYEQVKEKLDLAHLETGRTPTAADASTSPTTHKSVEIQKLIDALEGTTEP